jgi:prefoldin subunit 5
MQSEKIIEKLGNKIASLSLYFDKQDNLRKHIEKLENEIASLGFLYLDKQDKLRKMDQEICSLVKIERRPIPVKACYRRQIAHKFLKKDIEKLLCKKEYVNSELLELEKQINEIELKLYEFKKPSLPVRKKFIY